MKVTERLLEIYSRTGMTVTSGLQAVLDHLSAQGLLVEPFDPENWDGKTEPPIGWRVCASEGDVWLHGDQGWGMRGASDWHGETEWPALLEYAPFVLVPGGQVRAEDRA